MAKRKKAKRSASTARKMKRIMKKIRVLHQRWNAATSLQDRVESKAKARKYGKKAKIISKRIDKLEATLTYLKSR